MIKYSLQIFLLFFSIAGIAQHPVPFYENVANDNYESIEKDQIECLFKLYSSRIDPSYELIDGRGYFPYYFRSNLKPLLFLEKNHSSSVTLNDRKYDDISLDYDTFTDEVIYIDSTRICIYTPLMVALNKDKVEGFEFYDGTDSLSFRYYCKKSDPFFDLKDGYYEVVSDKESKYLIKHFSFLKKVPGIDDYIYLQAGYINVGNGFSKISGRREFIRIFGERSGEVRKYLDGSAIKIRKANKEQIMNVLNYYDSLEKPLK